MRKSGIRASEKLRETASFLKEKDLVPKGAFPLKEAEAILREGLGIDEVALLRDDPCLTKRQLKRLDYILSERAKRRPLQYILGNVDFYGLRIYVGEGVLIPRPETELIVEEVLKRFDKESRLKVLDLCTGSGCLALAVAKGLPSSDVIGIDISPPALRFARKNAAANKIKNVKFLKGCLFEGAEGPFDLITANPPYIKSSIIPALSPEVKDWEPYEALDGGEDGLNFIRAILKEAPPHLSTGGLLIMELALGQGRSVSGLAKKAGFGKISIKKDYSGYERVFIGAI
jgi:release factor glutamine methyltransferase